MWRIKSFIKGIKNLWSFRKVIWRFRGYDYMFTLDVLEKCLVEQYQELDLYSGDFSVNLEKQVSITLALYFIELIRKHDGDDKTQQIYIEKLSRVLSKDLQNWWY